MPAFSPQNFRKTLLTAAVAAGTAAVPFSAEAATVEYWPLESSKSWNEDVTLSAQELPYGGVWLDRQSQKTTTTLDAGEHQISFQSTGIRIDGGNNDLVINASAVNFKGSTWDSRNPYTGILVANTARDTASENLPVSIEFSAPVSFSGSKALAVDIVNFPGMQDKQNKIGPLNVVLKFNQGLTISNSTGTIPLNWRRDADLEWSPVGTTFLAFLGDEGTEIRATNITLNDNAADLGVSSSASKFYISGTFSSHGFTGSSPLNIDGYDFYARNIEIDSVTSESGGTTFPVSTSSVLFRADRVTVTNVTGGAMTAAFFAEHQGAVNVDSLTVDAVASTSDWASGILMSQIYCSIPSSKVEISTAKVSNVKGVTRADGVYLESFYDKFTANAGASTFYPLSTNIGSLSVEGVAATGDTGTANGLYMTGVTLPVTVGDLSVASISAEGENGSAYGVRLESAALNITGNADITLEESVSGDYKGAFSGSPSEEELNVRNAAVRVDQAGAVAFSGEGTRRIDGAILVGGDAGSESNPASLSFSGGTTQIAGDIYVANGGQLTLDASGSDSFIRGQIDDYHDLGGDSSAVRTVNFLTGSRSMASASTAGSASVSLSKGASWTSYGRSFVKSLAFGEGGGSVDLSKSEGASLTAGTLSGSGTFVMRASPTPSRSNMLYATDLQKGSSSTIALVVDRSEVPNIEALKGVRLATTNGKASGWGDEFKAEMKDQGVTNVTFTLAKSDYVKGDAANTLYNGEGSGKGTYRPGVAFADSVFGEEGTNWYIEEATETEPVTPVTPDTPDTPDEPVTPVQPDNGKTKVELSDAGRAVLGAARSMYWNAVDMDRLVKRLGEARYAKGEDGLWLRVRYDTLETSSGRGDFKTSAATYQAGFDRAFSFSAGRALAGVAIDWRDADVDFKGLSGDGDTRRFGVKAYGTWLGESGAYVDLVAQWGRLSNSFDIVNGSGGRVKGDFDNHVAGFSVEAGHKLPLGGEGWFAEPQLQLQYLHVTDGNYSTTQGSRIAQDSFNSVLTRAGFRAGRSFGAQKASSVYVKADWIREWSGKQKIRAFDSTTRASGYDASIENKGSWYDAGAGFQVALGRNAFAFADAEYRFGNSLESAWSVNAGVRLSF